LRRHFENKHSYFNQKYSAGFSFSSSDTESPTKYFSKVFWFFRTNCWSEFSDFPFNCQVIETSYWRQFCRELLHHKRFVAQAVQRSLEPSV